MKNREKVDALNDEFETYIDEHQDLDSLNKCNEDKVHKLMEKIHRMPELKVSFIYKQCQERENRCKKQILPEFKDFKRIGLVNMVIYLCDLKHIFAYR